MADARTGVQLAPTICCSQSANNSKWGESKETICQKSQALAHLARHGTTNTVKVDSLCIVMWHALKSFTGTLLNEYQRLA